MHLLDYIVIAAYLGVTIWLGILFSRGQSRNEFFNAGRSMSWLPVGLSVMATLFSSNSFVFYPSAAYSSSLRIGLSLVAFSLAVPIVAWFFVPVYTRLDCQTAYEYLERRFGLPVRCLASGLFVFLRIGWMASATYAASLVVASMADVPQPAVILVLGVVSIAYTILGGLRAVMWTDVLQFFIFAGTIVIALVLVFSFDSPVARDGAGGPLTRYFAAREHVLFDFTRSMTLTYGSWAILIGVFLEALSAYGADQVAVQRYLSASSEQVSQRGLFVNLAGTWLVVPSLLCIGAGLFIFYGDHPEELTPLFQDDAAIQELASAENPEAVARLVTSQNHQDKILPQFVKTHFPWGGKGLFLAALMAAIMSSIDSGIHSVTTALVVDFRDRLRPNWKPQSDRQDVFQIRLLTVTIGILSVGLALFVGPLGDVFTIGKMMTAAFGGPLLAVFLLAFFSPRSTMFGVFGGTLASAAITLALMVQHPEWFAVWFWPIGFGMAMLLSWGLSLLPIGKAHPEPLTWKRVVHDVGENGT
ncbi:MAG: sodium/solute symporter [Planctomycetaceae bacterium]|nr:sodium/solute symporter [Planctomycetaceae bacterium]